MLSFKPKQFHELVDLKGRHTIHFLVSDFNPLFKAESYQRIADWLKHLNPRRFFFYPTGTLQRPSRELEAIAKGKCDIKTVKKECERTESATINKILSSFELGSSGGIVIYRAKPNFELPTPSAPVAEKIASMRNELFETLERESKRLDDLHQTNIDYILSGDGKIVIKSGLDLTNKLHRRINQLNQDLKQLQAFYNRQLSVKHSLSEQPLSDERPNYLMSPPRVVAFREEGGVASSYGACIPWSNIVSKTEKNAYHERKAFFNDALKKKEEAEQFDALVNRLAEIRIQHILLDEKNVPKRSDPAWEPMIRKAATDLTREYLADEIPFFITQFDAAKLHERSETSYFCYPMKGPLGQEIFNYVTELYGRNISPVPDYFIFVDTTDLMEHGMTPEIKSRILGVRDDVRAEVVGVDLAVKSDISDTPGTKELVQRPSWLMDVTPEMLRLGHSTHRSVPLHPQPSSGLLTVGMFGNHSGGLPPKAPHSLKEIQHNEDRQPSRGGSSCLLL